MKNFWLSWISLSLIYGFLVWPALDSSGAIVSAAGLIMVIPLALALRKRIRKTKWQTLVAVLLILTVQVTLLVLLPYALKLLGS